MKIETKQDYWVEGYETYEEYIDNGFSEENENLDILFAGQTSDVPEGIAKECVEISGIEWEGYMNYKMNYFEFDSAKESIQSACDKPYCIIYKKN